MAQPSDAVGGLWGCGSGGCCWAVPTGEAKLTWETANNDSSVREQRQDCQHLQSDINLNQQLLVLKGYALSMPRVLPRTILVWKKFRGCFSFSFCGLECETREMAMSPNFLQYSWQKNIATWHQALQEGDFHGFKRPKEDIFTGK